MKRVIFYSFFLVVVFLANTSFSQQNYKEVVYLKNGSIISGVVIETIPNESIKIKTQDGNIFAFKMEEVIKITKEEITQINPVKVGKSYFCLAFIGLSIPTGDMSDYNVGPAFGSESILKFDSPVELDMNISFSYNSVSGSTTVSSYYGSYTESYDDAVSNLWITLGPRFEGKISESVSIYGLATAGLANDLSKSGGSDAFFASSLGFGVIVSKFNIGMRYMMASKNSTTMGFVGFNLGYEF